MYLSLLLLLRAVETHGPYIWNEPRNCANVLPGTCTFWKDMSVCVLGFLCASWCLFLERKAVANLDSVLKSRDITLLKKVHIVKAAVFPVIKYGCESWTIINAERWRTDAFELWCWRRLLRVPWMARRSNQSILKEINPEYSLAGMMLKLKLQYFATWCEKLTHWKSLIWERLKAGGEGDNKGWDGWMASPTQWTWVWTNFRR